MAIYGDIAGWRAYASARGDNAPTAASDVDAAAALQRASDYIRTRYVLPLGLADTDERLPEAAYIAANLELATVGFWSKTFTPGQIKTLTRAGEIGWTVNPNASMEKGYNSQIPVSPAIDALFGGTSNSGVFLGVMG